MIDLKTKNIPTWCPGCEDYILYAGVQMAINDLNLPKESLVVVSDIGCMGNVADFLNVYGIHSLHGRSIPTAIGVKLANPRLNVMVIGGDGGIYGEGLSHLIAAARLDLPVSVFVANNHLYSLTTGQASPTTPKGSKTKSTPTGVPSVALNIVPIIKTVNPEVFVEHLECRNPIEVKEGMKRAITSNHFALLDLDQVCVTFGKQLAG